MYFSGLQPVDLQLLQNYNPQQPSRFTGVLLIDLAPICGFPAYCRTTIPIMCVVKEWEWELDH